MTGFRPHIVGRNQEATLLIAVYISQNTAGDKSYLLRLTEEVFAKRGGPDNVPYNFAAVASGVVVPIAANGDLLNEEASTMSVLQAVQHMAQDGAPTPTYANYAEQIAALQKVASRLAYHLIGRFCKF